MKRRRGFTLVELVIVVAIIAILATIAIPNMLEAQTRAKVARVESELRSLAGALEAYHVDNNNYPTAKGVGVHASGAVIFPVSKRLIPLSTPIAYMTTIPPEVFRPNKEARICGCGHNLSPREAYDTYDYLDAASVVQGSGLTSGGQWRLCSAGPDLMQAYGGRTIVEFDVNFLGVDYDPTNGTTSSGDIVRVGSLAPTGDGGDPLDEMNLQRPGILRFQ